MVTRRLRRILPYVLLGAMGVACCVFLGQFARPPAQAQEAPGKGTIHDTYIFAQTDLVAGSTASLRVLVLGATSLTESVPIEGADVAIDLGTEKELAPEKAPAQTLFTGKTDAKGNANARFLIPDLPDGNYKMTVKTKSDYGQGELAQSVRLSKRFKILLVTDKPLYQPGQVIHIRALALNEFSLKPIAGQELTLEVEDSKGNKVFKRRNQTSDFGITSADFQLADEINLGDYKVTALLGSYKSEKALAVKKYVLPKFKIEVNTDKKFYLPKETVKGELDVNYIFGKPVAGGEVEIGASTLDVEFKDFQKVQTKTDENGHCAFEVTLPDYFVDQPLEKGNALVKLDISVKDTADHVEKAARTYNVSNNPINVSLMPESGRLVPGVENNIYVVTAYPDGGPAQADVTISIQGKKPAPVFEGSAKTNDAGFANFSFTPARNDLQPGGWVHQLDGPSWSADRGRGYYPMVMPVKVTAVDAQGWKAETTLQLKSEFGADNVLLKMDKAIYRCGESMKLDVLSTTRTGTAYIDVVKNRQTVISTMVDLENGKAHYDLDLTPEIFGSLELHAYQVMPGGDIIRDSKVAYVHPAQDLKIQVMPDKGEYKPADDCVIRFVVTDSQDRPVPSALAVIIVDEAVYALQEMQPGLEKVYFTLAKELQEPKYGIKYAPVSIPDLVTVQAVETRQQEAAKALLAAVEPSAEYKWVKNPQSERIQAYNERPHRIAQALVGYVQSGEVFAEYDAAAKTWGFMPNIFQSLVDKKWLPADALTDPWGKTMTVDALRKLSDIFLFDGWLDFADSAKKSKIFYAFHSFVFSADAVSYDAAGMKCQFLPEILQQLKAAKRLADTDLRDARGQEITLEKLAGEHKAFTPENMALVTNSCRKGFIFKLLCNRAEYGRISEITEFDAHSKSFTYRKDALAALTEGYARPVMRLADGTPLDLNALGKADKAFSAENMVRMGMRSWTTIRISIGVARTWQKTKLPEPPEILPILLERKLIQPENAKDPWGNRIELVNRGKDVGVFGGSEEFRKFGFRSDGPDCTPGTGDDITETWLAGIAYYWGDEPGMSMLWVSQEELCSDRSRKIWELWEYYYGGRYGGESKGRLPDDWDTGGAGASWAGLAARNPRGLATKEEEVGGSSAPGATEPAAGAKPIRIREYFPETLLWNPSLITDDKGIATLPLKMADSITTWRLTASASSKNGLLGGASAPIRCFQDFFVDIDLPVCLTQNDEVSIPVAVYNYLKEDQTVKLTLVTPENAERLRAIVQSDASVAGQAALDPESVKWFELLDEPIKGVRLETGEIRPIYFRIRVKDIGFNKLTVIAEGTKMSDAIRRSVEIVPDGKMFETVVNDRLAANVSHRIDIPANSIPDSYKLILKCYPGVFSQVVEGIEGMLRMPYG